jgi:hypothetical protein
MQAGSLVTVEKQGRHRYYRLTGPDVDAMLETIIGVAERAGHTRTKPGPKEPALRQARICYDHLAGDLGVRLFDSLMHRGLLAAGGDGLALSRRGERFVTEFGIDLAKLSASRRPLCRTCLDWSVRRHHLAGALGGAMLDRFFSLKWAHKERGTRVVTFTPRGRAQFDALFSTRAAR